MNYLGWLTSNTQTRWWHDSAIPEEIDDAIASGALGVTTNPVLTYKSLQAVPDFWQAGVEKIPQTVQGPDRAEELLKLIATYAAKKLDKIYKETNGEHGYAFGQVNPLWAADTEKMLEQGLRYSKWAPNMAVKIPTTSAALPVVEELAAKGIALCTTLNFSVAQAIAAAEAYERGLAKARRKGIQTKPCFVVQQGGRLDDYLLDIARDSRIPVLPEDVMNAGNIVSKRSYQLFRERGYSAVIMPAGLRGTHHLSSLAGARMVFSLQYRVQKLVNEEGLAQVEHIDDPMDQGMVQKLKQIPEFVRAYEPEALPQKEFISFGVTQRTLSQFLWTGWYPLETYGSKQSPTYWF